jgi:hypothetical protein
MAKLSSEDLLKRAEKARANLSLWLGLLDMAYRYGFPQKDILSQTPGARRGIQVYDSTAPDSAIRLANRICTDMFPPFQEWADLDAGEAIGSGPNKDSIKKELQKYQRMMFECFHNSNFDDAINEYAQELTVGTGALAMLRGTVQQPFKFFCTQIINVAIDEGPFGMVDGKFVCLKGSYRALKAMFLVEEMLGLIKWPEEFGKRAIAPETADKETELHDCVYTDWDTMEVCHDVLWKEGKASIFIKPQVEATSPWIVSRWAKNAGESYGRGPIIACLPTILTVNKVVEYTLKGAAYRIAPISTVANDGTNPATWRLEPGSFLPVERNDGHPNGPSVGKLDFGGDPQLADLVLQDLRAIIKRGFHDQSLPPDTGPVRSAYEIAQRMKELSADLGGVFGRLHRELVNPLVLRALNLMQQMRMIEFPLVINGTTVKVIPKSPLAKLQNLSKVEAVVQWMQIVQSMGPEIAMLGIKVEDLPAWIGDQLGVPKELQRDEREREKMQLDIAAIVASQSQAAQQPQAAPQQAPRAAA